MRTRLSSTMVAVAVVLAFSSLLFAHMPKQSGVNPRAAQASAQAFNPRDINGIWVLGPRGKGALATLSNERPPLTPWGQAKFATVKPTHESWDGQKLGPKIPEKDWNDPTLQCSPTGYPRIMFQPYGELARFVQTGNEILQFTEWDHTWRDIWTDGRKLPDDPEPRYYGFAVGHWDGDTLVVDSNGFTEKTWLDYYGSPHSDQMTLRETFHRVDHDNMEWTITLTDPKTYTKPWVSRKMMLEWKARSPRAETDELREDFCVWADQASFFSRVDSTGVGDALQKRK